MSVEIRLLGGFEVVVDGDKVTAGSWQRRAAADLVKLLALTDGHRLHRERVLEALWPGVDVASSSPRLHKAAHYARRAMGRPDAVVVRGETVALLPDDAESLRLWASLSPLEGANQVTEVRPGSHTLLEHPRERALNGGALPILVAGRAGEGRVAAGW